MMSYRSTSEFRSGRMIFHWKLRPLDFELFAVKISVFRTFFLKCFAAFELIFGM